ncbi:MAG: GIY-YIG nuclease family protein [Rhodospirillales bacterium]|nr:GIY-YIG nuclease family protein [Rhodospirillales bacterium]
MTKPGYVYILASGKNGTLYIGVTSDLVARVWQHKQAEVEGFTKRYDIKTLVYFEVFDSIEDAIAREKAMKKWRRAWKIRHIEKANPDWRDLYDEIAGLPPARE